MAEAKRTVKPLCSTCAFHENYAMKLVVLWYAGIALVVIFMPLLGWTANDIYAQVRSNAQNIIACDEKSTYRDKEQGQELRDSNNKLAETFHNSNEKLVKTMDDIIAVLNVASINQKRTMEYLNLKYLSPEWVRHGNDKIGMKGE